MRIARDSFFARTGSADGNLVIMDNLAPHKREPTLQGIAAVIDHTPNV